MRRLGDMGRCDYLRLSVALPVRDDSVDVQDVRAELDVLTRDVVSTLGYARHEWVNDDHASFGAGMRAMYRGRQVIRSDGDRVLTVHYGHAVARNRVSIDASGDAGRVLWDVSRAYPLVDPRVTRADFAVDLRLGSADRGQAFLRQVETFAVGQNLRTHRFAKGDVFETVYLGGRQSELLARAYDRHAKTGRDDDQGVYRFEFEGKPARADGQRSLYLGDASAVASLGRWGLLAVDRVLGAYADDAYIPSSRRDRDDARSYDWTLMAGVVLVRLLAERDGGMTAGFDQWVDDVARLVLRKRDVPPAGVAWASARVGVVDRSVGFDGDDVPF